MNVREQTQQIERLTLAPWASFSDASRGRARPERKTRSDRYTSGTGTGSSTAKHSAG